MKIIQVLIALFVSPFLAFCLVTNASAECPDPQWVCDYWPTVLEMNCPTVTGFCAGDDCMMGARGDEILVSASDDPEDLLEGIDGYTTRWLARHHGDMANFSCEDLILHKHGDFVIMPEQRHCAVALETSWSDIYLEFFASNPASECTGWVECLCE